MKTAIMSSMSAVADPALSLWGFRFGGSPPHFSQYHKRQAKRFAQKTTGGLLTPGLSAYKTKSMFSIPFPVLSHIFSSSSRHTSAKQSKCYDQASL